MEEYYVVYSSITFATRIKKYFEHSRYHVTLMHTPSEISKGGCSYAVRVKREALADVISISKSYRMRIRGVYKKVGDSYFEVIV